MKTLKAIVMCAGLLGTGATVTGCAAQFEASAGAVASEPTLVAIGPGMWVVENHSQAIFYTDDYYWRWDSGSWYRSASWSSGWVLITVDVVPVVVKRIDRPAQYVYYKAPPGAEVRTGPPPRGYVAQSTPSEQGTPPGHGGTPPGHGGTPPGHGGTPPGHGGTPPGHGGTPPGHDGAHPGHKGKALGHTDVPPGHGGTPPGHGGPPPGQTLPPPGQTATNAPANAGGPPPQANNDKDKDKDKDNDKGQGQGKGKKNK